MFGSWSHTELKQEGRKKEQGSREGEKMLKARPPSPSWSSTGLPQLKSKVGPVYSLMEALI